MSNSHVVVEKGIKVPHDVNQTLLDINDKEDLGKVSEGGEFGFWRCDLRHRPCPIART